MASGDGEAYYSDDFEIAEDTCPEDEEVPTITIFKSSRGAGLVVKPNHKKPSLEQIHSHDHDEDISTDFCRWEFSKSNQEDRKHHSPLNDVIEQLTSARDSQQSPRDSHLSQDSPRPLSDFLSSPRGHEWLTNTSLANKSKRTPLRSKPKSSGLGKNTMDNFKFKGVKSNESIKGVTFSPRTVTQTKFPQRNVNLKNQGKGRAAMSRSNYSIRSNGSQHSMNFTIVGKGQRRGVTTTQRSYGRDAGPLQSRARSTYGPLVRIPLRLGPAKAGGSVAERVASAKRMTVNELRNKIGTLNEEISDLRKENRSLKHVERRQQNAIKKWEGKDADLPRLLQQHKDDLQTSSELLRKSQGHCRDLENKLRTHARQIAKLESELQSLKTLASNEDLQARSTLQENIEMLATNLSGTEARLRHYMRHVEILEKNHNHQIANEQQKLIKANNHALELRHEITRLKLALRDKDRMLNYIQMRSTGRNLLRAFQEDERKHALKFNCQIGAASNTSQLSQRSNDSRTVITSTCGPTLHGTRLSGQSQSQAPELCSLSRRTLDLDLDEHNDDAEISFEFDPLDDSSKHTFNSPTEPMKNSYYKISKMLDSNNPHKPKPTKSLKSVATTSTITSTSKKSISKISPLASMDDLIKSDQDQEEEEVQKEITKPKPKLKVGKSDTGNANIKKATNLQTKAKKIVTSIKSRQVAKVESEAQKLSRAKCKAKSGRKEKKETKVVKLVSPIKVPGAKKSESGRACTAVEVCVQIKKSPRDEQGDSSASEEDSETSQSKSEDETEEVQVLESLSSLLVPPPPKTSSEEIFEYNQSQTQISLNNLFSPKGLDPRSEALLKSHEEAMDEFRRKNSQTFSPLPRRHINTVSYSTPEFHTSPRDRHEPSGSHNSNGQCQVPMQVGLATSARFDSSEEQVDGGFFKGAPNYPSSSRSTRSYSTYQQGDDHGNAYEGENYRRRSRGSERGSEFGYSRIPVPFSYKGSPNAENIIHSPKEVYSFPQVKAYQDSPTHESRGIFSYSNSMASPSRIRQPMDLPFFSMSGNEPSQIGDQIGYATPVNRIQSSHNPSSKKKSSEPRSSYDPNFFSKLGTWK